MNLPSHFGLLDSQDIDNLGVIAHRDEPSLRSNFEIAKVNTQTIKNDT